MGRYFVSVVIACYALVAWADIREIMKMDEIVSEVDKETLLIYDLDNTVMEPIQMLGSHQWYDYLVEKYQSQGLSKDHAKKRAVGWWIRAHTVSKMKPVEEDTPKLISQQQKAEINIMALTARHPVQAENTRKQLGKIGVDLTKKPAFKENTVFSVNEPAKYIHGILFANPANDKGKVLAKFLELAKLKPKKIVMVDDRKTNLENVQAALAPSKVEFIGFRYGATDANVKKFKPQIVEVQMKYFFKVLSDKDAKAILETSE